MNISKSPNRIALYLIRAFVIFMLLFYFLYFLGLTGASKKQAIFSGVFCIGIVSIWAGYYHKITKLPFFRGKQAPYKLNQTFIEYSKSPGDHQSSVLGLFILGIFFVIIGLNGILNA